MTAIWQRNSITNNKKLSENQNYFDMPCDSFNADFDRFDMTFSQTSNTSSQKHNTSLEVCVDHVFIRIDSDITIERTSICNNSNLMALCAVKYQRAYVNLIH